VVFNTAIEGPSISNLMEEEPPYGTVAVMFR
jgi:hypothetical protein